MPGRAFVLGALGFALLAVVLAPASLGRREGRLVAVRSDLLEAARRAIVGSTVMTALAAITLWHAFFTRDFSLDYVAVHSSSTTPPWYTFSALWAGMDGSMLLWCLLLGLYAAAFVRRNPAREPYLPVAIPVLGLVIAFFTAMTATLTNPFRPAQIAVVDGRGLNPLLQSPGMVIHPPMLYAGFIGLLLPMTLVLAALILGRTGDEWIGIVRRWMLVPWLALGTGLVLGGAWAYTELGWGGYWAWDPVENAALMPWLAATAFLHSAVVQERRGLLKVWNVVLVFAAADLAIFGTFLTRSGLLSSVHTFTESPLGRWFFGFMAVQTLAGLGVLAWRLPGLRADRAIDSATSREAGFLLNNLLFCGATLTVLWGTLLPIMSEAALGREIAVGPPFFNRVMAPLGALLLLLAALGPVMPWRRGTLRGIARRLRRPALLAAITTLPALATRHVAFTVVWGIAALTFWVGVLEIWEAWRARARRLGRPNRRALLGLLARNPRRYGGYVIHIGVAIMVVGFAGSLFRTQTDLSLLPGQSAEFAGYTLTYERMETPPAPDKDIRMAVLHVSRAGRSLGTLRPQQNVHRNFDQPQSEIAIHTTPRQDLYVILTGTFEDSDRANLRLYANPLVFWVWSGAAVAVAGGLVALLARPRPRRPRPTAGSPDTPAPVEASWTS